MKNLSRFIFAAFFGIGFAFVASATRNGSGTNTLPAGNPFIPGTTISSTTMNTTMSDISTEITSSLDRSGRGAMLAQLPLYSGTVSAPGLGFGSETNSGIYRIGASNIGFSLAGTLTTSWTAAGFVIGSGGTAISKSIGVTQTVDVANTVANTCTDTTAITMTGMTAGQPCVVGQPSVLLAGSFTCYSDTSDQVVLRYCNPTTGALNPASASFKFRSFSP